MKANCQFCGSGENEESLLLCDACDKGYHTYCFKPEMVIPQGDWLCCAPRRLHRANGRSFSRRSSHAVQEEVCRLLSNAILARRCNQRTKASDALDP